MFSSVSLEIYGIVLNMFKNISAKYKECFLSRKFIISAIISVGMLLVAFVINSYAVNYVNEAISNSVTDIVLSNTPVFDLDGFFVNGAILLVIFIAFVILWNPKRLPFSLKTISVFIIIRSVFIMLTHIGPFPIHAIIDPSTEPYIQDIIGRKMFSSLFLGNDFFFSGHTGLPFLMVFLYYDHKWLRWMFIILSILFGVVVLLSHLHYTIDVLSAFFISYGIYRISRILFREDMPIDLIDYDRKII